jgi:thiol-disulfide isomerase/thioredoxin
MVAKSGSQMSYKPARHYLYIGVVCLITSLPGQLLASDKVGYETIATTDQNEITAEIYHADSKIIFIWQPHERGLQEIDRQFARALAQQGIEVWLTDLLEAWFLPNTASNMDKLPATAFSALIAAASKTGKRVVIGASGRGTVPALRGIRQWQLEHPGSSIPAGVVMVSAKLFVETPDPGLAGTLLPIVEATNIPVVLLQPNKSPWFWKLEQTTSGLQKNGSEVFIWPISNVRDRFYFRPDATDYEIQLAARFHQQLASSIKLLGKLDPVARQAKTESTLAPSASDRNKERVLEVFKGKPEPPPLVLPDLQDNMFDLNSLAGNVVLVNFWATWCPPCVHEMPSMQRLADHFGKQPFTILGVNMAEEKQDVEAFLQNRVSVSFPIIMDKDGSALKNWKVFAFPTSYVLDKQGKIRYALFGGIEWDTPDTINKIQKLLDE